MFFEKNIIYYDNHILIAVKPAGILSQKDKTGDDSVLEMVKAFVKEKFSKPGEVFIGSIHRLDRPASGLMVFARTSKALSRMNESFRMGRVTKKYLAIVEGIPSGHPNKLIHYLEKDSRKNKVRVYSREGENRKKAILQYDIIESKQNLSLLSIGLETGRPHQIRAQMSHIKCPIVGDLKYGSKLKTDGRSIALLSYELSFEHPVKKEIQHFKLDYPHSTNYWKLFGSV